MLLEEFHDEVGRVGGELVAAGMDEGHDRGAEFRRIEGAARLALPGLAFAALVDPSEGVHHLLLPFEFDELVVFACDVQHGLGGEFWIAPGGDGGRGGHGGEHVSAFRPQQIGEAAAVRVAGGVNASGVHFVILPEARKDGVEELEIPVAQDAGTALPAGFRALGIGEAAGSVEPLRVDDNRLRPAGVNVKHSGGVVHRAAMPVEYKDDRGWRSLCRGGGVNEGLADGAVHGPLPGRGRVRTTGGSGDDQRGKTKEADDGG